MAASTWAALSPAAQVVVCAIGASLVLTTLRVLLAALALTRSIVPVKAAPKAAPRKKATTRTAVAPPAAAPSPHPAPPARPRRVTPAASTNPTRSTSLKTTTTTSHPSGSPLHLAALKGHDAALGGVAGLAVSGGGRVASAGDRAVRVVGLPPSSAPPARREVGAAALGVAFVPSSSGADPAVAVLTRGGTGDAPALAALGAGRTPLWSLPAPGEAFLGGHRALAVRSGAGILAVASEKSQLDIYATPASGGAAPPARLASIDTAGIRTHDLAVSANGAWVAAATFAPDVRLHAVLKGGRVLAGPALGGHTGQVLAVALSGDGSAAATSCRDGRVAVWSLPTWTRHDTRPEAGPPARLRWRAPAPVPAGFVYRRLALDPAGAVLAAGTERGDLHFLDARTGALLSAVEPAHAGSITALEWAVGQGGKAVLVSAGEDGAVHVWASPADVAA